MSRTYSYKPSIKKRLQRMRIEKRVTLSDYDIEYLEMKLGPSISLNV